MAGAVPADTTVEAHAAQRAIYEHLGGRGRVDVMFRLTHTVRRLTLAGIRARHPAYSDTEIRLAYARLVLGDDLVRAMWPGCTLLDP